MLKIVIHKRALQRMNSVADWYLDNVGYAAASKFVRGIYSTINTLAAYPSMGRVEQNLSTSRYTYYSFTVHPKYRIIYRYNDRKIDILAIYCNMMQSGGL
ncbi:MAG: type II toxin-antitoxin system RelE/ParE family toxin [Bacteroidaceae bacterium]|nr:type II toxin-antitoxin system RelE/ParE family toxin [Bacteroidaceae bacterium]